MYFDKDQVDPTLQEEPAEELSHTDKILGVFASPGETFQQISKFKLRFTDWLIPFFVLVVVATLSFAIKMSNPEVKSEYLSEQLKKQEIALSNYPSISEEQREKQLEVTKDFYKSKMFLAITGVFVLFFNALFLFLPALLILLFGKVVFKGTGGYQSALIGMSMPNYIASIGLLLSAGYTLATKKFALDFSLRVFLNADGNYFLGLFYSIIDPIGIWAVAVAAIALTKLYQLKSYYPMAIISGALYLLGKYMIYQN